ncbi:hypothetical protein BAUCODRAFT_57236, partial [Baudoinia panamericana UAMH 10762]
PPAESLRNANLKLDTMSPVTQNGSFVFDRIIKSGQVLKRTRKTKTCTQAWKPIYIVLRPNLLSIYRDSSESKLRHQINLSDVTAVARRKDPKRQGKFVFGVFTPARNFHLEAQNEQEAQEWVELVRREAHMDEEEEEMYLASPGGATTVYHRGNTGVSSASAVSGRRPSQVDYSGAEHGSYSDFSDFTPAARLSNLSLATDPRPSTSSTQPQHSVYGPNSDPERVVYHGYIFLLKSATGVRSWKKVWMVLRPKAIALYKNDSEYTAMLILPFSTIIDVVEIDPISRSKTSCMQIINEERNYRFCALDEESLARWLGAFKSVLSKRK